MMPNQKNIMLRFSFIILVMVLIGIAIICKAGVIMFAERQYWKDVADRFVKENVTVRPTRGNIISSDGQLMASSLPEYKIYMDFTINKRKSETEEEEKNQKLWKLMSTYLDTGTCFEFQLMIRQALHSANNRESCGVHSLLQSV